MAMSFMRLNIAPHREKPRESQRIGKAKKWRSLWVYPQFPVTLAHCLRRWRRLSTTRGFADIFQINDGRARAPPHCQRPCVAEEVGEIAVQAVEPSSAHHTGRRTQGSVEEDQGWSSWHHVLGLHRLAGNSRSSEGECDTGS
jgi:hypothetical protein